jgi:hypothetical protein
MALVKKAWNRYRADGLDGVVRTAWRRTSTSLRLRLHACNPVRRRTVARIVREGTVDERLRRCGLAPIPLELSAPAFHRWFADTSYPDEYCPGPWRQALPEKALEHYLSLELLRLTPDAVCVDVASQDSPFPDLVRSRLGCRVYRQDLEYPAGLHGDRIGGDAAELPLPPDSVTAMTLHCSFEHFEGRSDVEFLREAARVLVPGGRVCILPLYLRDDYLNVLDPRATRPLHADPEAKVYSISDWPGGHFSRYYSPEVFRTRIVDAVPTFSLRLYRLTNPEAAGPGCYLRYAAVFEKPI